MQWRYSAVLLCLMFSLTMQAQDAVPVRVVMPEQQALAQQLELSGSLTAQQDATLSSRSAGLVHSVLVDVGAMVNKGEALLTLDTALAEHELAQRRAALNAAKVQLAEQQRQVTEAEQLTAQQLFPQTELSLRRAALAQAEALQQQAGAALAQQQEVLARHTLIAPFTGVIAKRFTDVGEWLAPGTPVMQLVSQTPLLLDVQVPQEFFSELNTLRHIEVVVDALSAETFTARLSAAVPVGDASARTFLARLQLNDTRQRLLPGSSARATLRFERDDSSVLLVPPDALLRHPDGNFSVFSVSENTARRHNVTLGRSNAQGVEIVSGLPRQQPVVVRGNETLRDGQAVRVLSDDKE